MLLRPHDDYYYQRRPADKKSYLFLNGSDEALQEVVTALQRSNIEFIKSGKASYPAPNHRQYAWFIQVKAGDDSPTLDQMFGFIRDFNYRRRDQINQKIQTTQTEISREQEKAAETGLSEKSVRLSELEAQLRQMQAEKANLETQIATLESDSKTKDALVDEAAQKVEEAAQKIEEKEAILTEFSKDHSDLENMCDQLRAENHSLNEQLREKSDRIEELEDSLNALANPRTSEDLESLVSAIFPDVEFVRYSLGEILSAYSNHEQLFSEIKSIAWEKAQGESVQSTKNWHERRLASGNGYNGRIYFTHPQDGKRRILVSRKTDQKTDIEWMKKND